MDGSYDVAISSKNISFKKMKKILDTEPESTYSIKWKHLYKKLC